MKHQKLELFDFWEHLKYFFYFRFARYDRHRGYAFILHSKFQFYLAVQLTLKTIPEIILWQQKYEKVLGIYQEIHAYEFCNLSAYLVLTDLIPYVHK